MSKRKVKVWGKINLFETSVVGIPAYPDAHFNTNSLSLVKALKSTDEGVITERGVKKVTAEKTDVKQNNVDKSETVEVEKQVQVETEKTVESVTAEQIAGMISKGIKEAMSELETERGLVEQEKTSKDLSKKSIGELAIMSGLFKAY